MNSLTHISLFSGIGSIDLATEWAGFKTVLFVEIDPYCQKVLKKHWPDVPIIGDIRDVTKEKVSTYTEGRRCAMSELQCDTQETEGGGGRNASQSYQARGIREGREATFSPVTLITGGFPCQPVSQAGKRRGTEDDRWLWPEMLRVISEVRPDWVVAENVGGLQQLEKLDSLFEVEGKPNEDGDTDTAIDYAIVEQCCQQLEEEGYEVIPFLIPACAVNAPHRRDRIFIVAHDNSVRCDLQRLSRKGIQRGDKPCRETGTSGEDVADTSRERLQGSIYSENSEAETMRINSESKTPRATSQADVADTARGRFQQCESQREAEGDISKESGNWAVEPELGRENNGVSGGMDRNLDAWENGWEDGIPRVISGQKNRVDRLRCLGNAVVPAQIFPILDAIRRIENGETT